MSERVFLYAVKMRESVFVEMLKAQQMCLPRESSDSN